MENAIGLLNSKGAIHLHREFESVGMGNHFWNRGYNVSTVGLDEVQIRRYIQVQEKFDR